MTYLYMYCISGVKLTKKALRYIKNLITLHTRKHDGLLWLVVGKKDELEFKLDNCLLLHNFNDNNELCQYVRRKMNQKHTEDNKGYKRVFVELTLDTAEVVITKEAK